jgi:hypothetical protein
MEALEYAGKAPLSTKMQPMNAYMQLLSHQQGISMRH